MSEKKYHPTDSVIAVTGVTPHNFKKVADHARSLGARGVLAGYGFWKVPEIKLVIMHDGDVGTAAADAKHCEISWWEGGEKSPCYGLWFALHDIPADAFLKVKSLYGGLA